MPRPGKKCCVLIVTTCLIKIKIIIIILVIIIIIIIIITQTRTQNFSLEGERVTLKLYTIYV